MRVTRATPETFRFRQFASQFLAAESRCVDPDEAAPHSFLLVFPNEYEAGMSNLGYQSIYRLVNSAPHWSCERAFLYPKPWGSQLRSLETARRGETFQVIGFSCSFEMDYPHVVAQIASTGIPLRAEERDESHPVFVLGGAVTFYNPLPLAPFFDVILLGEAEPVLNQLLAGLAEGWERLSRAQLLARLAQMEGIWCPAIEPQPRSKKRLAWAVSNGTPSWSCIVSRAAHLEEMFLVEVGRGCGRRCRFCVASHVYYPLRMWSPGEILATIDRHNVDRRRVGLVGAALADYPWLRELLTGLIERGLGCALSSLRIDAVDEALIELLERGGVRSIALAPETASPRLQRVIHKNLDVSRMLATADLLARSRIERVKLYFLIGLPFERDEDVAASADFAAEFARRLQSHGARKHLTVSANAFIPKPHTPFQWSGMAPIEVLQRRKHILRERLSRERGIELDLRRSSEEWLQAFLSLGGPEVAEALLTSVVSQRPLRTVLRELDIEAEAVVHAQKADEAPFPWDFILGGPDRQTLLRQWKLAQQEAELPDARS